MKYSFEVIPEEGGTLIKIDVSTIGGYVSNISRSIKVNNDNNNSGNLDAFLLDIINNMRLTVTEREDALNNCEIFKNFLKTGLIYDAPVEQMIVENGDPSVLGDPDKYIK